MADQRANAGNIGDVIKHSLLAELVWSFGNVQDKEWVYCETHAGFYEYDLTLLKNGQKWKDQRAWSVGIVEHSGQMLSLGKYGVELAEGLKNSTYPGSICMVDKTTRGIPTLKGIYGWDLDDGQVASFVDKSDRICVSAGDGYAGVKTVHAASKLIFCDPFWTNSGEVEKVIELLNGETPVIVWYPLSANTKAFQNWLHKQKLIFLEVCYRIYRGGDGWGRDMQGAGLVVRGLPDASISEALRVAQSLNAIFEGKTYPGTPSRKKAADGSIRTPPDRELSLRITYSF